jgi:hypothetical protein
VPDVGPRKWIRAWVLPFGARGSADYRRLARPWRDWSGGLRACNDAMRVRAREGRDRLVRLRVPPRFAADHERLLLLLEPVTEGAQEDRLRVAAERRIEAQGLSERMGASASTSDELQYVHAVGLELERRHARGLAMYDEWERLTTKFAAQLAGMKVPAIYADLVAKLADAVRDFHGQTVRQRAALADRDYIRLGEEGVEWNSVNARLEELRREFREMSPLKD